VRRKIALPVRLGESEVGWVLYNGRLDIVVTEERDIKPRIVAASRRAAMVVGVRGP